ncbi:CCR4-NOT transcription complex subunit 1 [Lingula anatina]|uniref:CCR4-NOT transcription complex subunit 1 n=1 Tax=Lingula anatina TaxID=7574 RepID=A0A1S3K5X9_LINAN|nr:CCR4-NOT transcription complex subunit 1 [Lingula anatina]|eukprot:XP_013418035.1 CCR4-NOT transcription complex subunit 1 [Lingula anatina]
MNLDSLSFALSQISYSVANLTKKNFKSSVSEISHLVSQHGAEAERHLYRCLFSHVDFSGDGKSTVKDKDFHQTQYLIQESSALISKPNFVSILCFAIDNPLHQQKTLRASPHLLPQLSKFLKLTKVQEVVFGLALLSSSVADTRTFAAQFVKQKFPDLLRCHLDSDPSVSQESGLQEVAVEVVHFLLTHLAKDRESFDISSDQKEAFIKSLQRDFPKDRVPVVLSPLLYPELQDLPLEKLNPDSITMPKSMMEGSLADILLEAGYGCTASVEECRTTLLQVGARELTAGAIARVLGMMARTPTGLGDQVNIQSLSGPGGSTIWSDGKDKPDSAGISTWNVDVFVQVVHDMGPHINWREVVSELDHEGFLVLGKPGLRLLVQALFRGLRGDVFPVEYIYRTWKNTEGQLSWLSQSLKNPDVFCFADYPCHPVVIDILKTPPDDENREIATWKSLDLVEVLLKLSDAGLYQQITELFKFPIQHCPDMLVLALLQISPNWNTLKHELISTLMPIFLGNHPNSGVVLHYAWHCQSQSTTIRTLIMHSMAEWYMRGEHHDQSRLSRILDVAQDLKALSMLLNATPFAFVIDLACLASRREYLKLDKWLSDKMREHGEPFIQACVNFLKRRCPQLTGPGMKDDQPQSKSQQLPPETLTTMLACLHACAGNVSPELSENILTMFGNASHILQKARQTAPGVVGGKGVTPPIGPPPTGLNQMDPMTSLGPLSGLGVPPPGGFPSGPGFPQGLAASLSGTPASPAKNFPNVSQSTPPAQPGFNPMQTNPMQNLTSQLQNLGIQTSMPSGGLGIQTSMASGARSLSALSMNATLKQQQQQPPNVERLRQASQQDEVASLFQEPTQQFSKEVEDEANSYFQRIYNHPPHPTITIDEVLEMLKRFKDSPVKKERDVFACMLRNLFEEYRFFPQYPEKELQTTAILFGGIIEQGLVTYMALGVALRYVLDALRKPSGSKMYLFGIAALDRFKTRLKDYPVYCQHLARIPHFSQFPQHMIEYVDFGSRSQEPPNRPQGPVVSTSSTRSLTPSGPPVVSTVTVTTTTTTAAATAAVTKPTSVSFQTKPSIANATNIDTLLAGTEGKEETSVPPEALQDKVFFIFNNLSLANMAQKAEELREHVSLDYIPWVSQYMVMKRASIEPNFHTLYANFAEVLKIQPLSDMIISETYRNIKILLRSDKAVANFSDRTLLKNLGHWLGMLTLAKNKPILHVDIDLKSLLYEAYSKGERELLYVVPFVAKVIESSSKSRVFKPPNPWTMGIMNVLAELHQEHELKLNLKFEIEVLCKTLNIDINSDLTAGHYLKDPSRMERLVPQLSPPKPKEPMTSEQLQVPPPSLSMGMGGMEEAPSSTTSLTTFSVSATTTVPTPVVTSTPAAAMMTPPQPQFAFGDVNVSSLTGLAAHVSINEQLALFQAHPQLKQYVRPALERAVQELLPPVVERSIKIALTTCEMIVKKDFALDPEEARLRSAAHHMVRSMTAAMALITCREPLLITIGTQIKNTFLSILKGATQPQKELIEQAAPIIAQDNTELSCAFIQKTAVEKAIAEIDRRLATEYDLRKHARNEGRRYCDPVVLTYQAERMPEQIRLKVGGVTPQQISVYEEFHRNIPGFLPNAPETAPPTSAAAAAAAAAGVYPAKPPASYAATDEITAIYEKIATEIDNQLKQIIAPQSTAHVAALHGILDAVVLARNSREIVTALSLLQKTVEGLLEGLNPSLTDTELLIRYRDCHLLVLRGLQDPRAYGPQWTNKQVTRCLVECREDYRYNLDAVDCLIKSHLVNMQQYDLHLAQQMENGLNYMAVAFAMQLVQRYCVEEKQTGMATNTEADFYNTIETLGRIAIHSRQAPDGLAALIEAIRAQNDTSMMDRTPGGPTSMMQSGISQAREFDDPPGLHEKTEFLLREWVNMYHSPAAGRDSTKAFSAFVQQMHQQGILKTDDLITRFFRLCTEMCVDLCYRALSEQSSPTLIRAKCFHTLDAFVRLIALLVKHSGDSANTVTKINLLNKVLGIVAGVLLQDHEVRGTDFQQLPYHRIFIMLFIELNAPEHVLESINFQVLTAFCNTFHILRPAKAPGFAFAWLELISHRVFIGRMLAITPQQRGWSMYAQLLSDLFKFLAPFLRNANLDKPTQLLYKGTLRVLLVLLHDFPEFLCDFHYAFCDVIPPNCIQMRNLILSAFPRNMRLPDPFTPNLKVDMLPEIAMPPRIMTNFAKMIQPKGFKNDMDSYLTSRSPVTFLSELRSSLQISSEPGNRYNIPLINALVLYVGTQAITFIHSKGLQPSMSTIAHSSHMDIFQNLAVDLDTEGRYLFLNAIANQLRYPNSHTHYFSCTLLYLFAEANSEAIQEQITRVLLERLIVNRPHPWGLLITFIELIKNPSFKFWNHDFVHCAPEIEKLFESVARSCMQPKQQGQAIREQDGPQEVH